MTVKELIEILQCYPDDMEVMNRMRDSIDIEKGLWIDTNYPYDKPEKEILIVY